MSEQATVQSQVTAKPVISPLVSGVLQRQCACGQHTSAGGECEECKKKRENTVQRAAINSTLVADVPPIVHEVLHSSGQPLAAATRAFMEPRFGRDFSGVRVHIDAQAAESAQAVGARAYTVGQDIAFARDQYQPYTVAGAELLAHELTHTVQQASLRRAVAGENLSLSAESDASEREASAVATAVMQGLRPAISARPAPLSLSRSPWGECPAGTKRTLNEDFGELLKARSVAAGTAAAKDKRAKFFTFQAAEAAEDYIAGYFKSTVGPYAHTNKDPLSPQDADPESDPVQYMINEAHDHFRSGGSSKVRKKKTKPSAVKPPAQARTVIVPVSPVAIDEGQAVEAATPGRTGAQLKPDCVDFGASRVYDVTTLNAAKDKVQKLKGYAKLYESIRVNAEYGPIEVPEWAVGTELPVPPKFTFGLQDESDPIKICFGVTDFDKYPGVLAYQVVDTSTAPGADAGAAGSTSEPYELSIGGQALTAYAQPAPSTTDLLNSGPANKAIAESIPGVILHKLNRKKKGADTIEAEIETATNSKSAHKSIMPIETVGARQQVIYQVNAETRKLKLASSKANIPIKYPKLSAGAITKLEHSDETGLSGEGHIKPSIPLLKDLDIHFAFAPDTLAVKIPAKKPRIPIPGFTVTDFVFSLELLPEFKPAGTIAFTIGTGRRTLINGVITITADAEGLLATGEVIAHIPGVDEAKGTVTYRPSAGWSGLITITTSKIRYVKNANVTVALSDQGLELIGGLTIVLPGDQSVALSVAKRGATRWVYIGRGEFRVPRLKPVIISFVYDGEDVSGTAKTGFKFKGLEGDIQLNYENGIVTGTGRLEILKSNGRLKGYLSVTLNKNQKFSGEGLVSYEIKPGLVASANIILDQNEKVTVVGMLTFPPYQLFDQHPNPPQRINIFKFPPKKIPVPFLSFGPLGLQAEIGAGIFMSYGIGPGVIKDGFIKAKVDPLEDNPDPEFELGGRLSIPMFFRLTGYVSGGLVLDVIIAEAGGKLIVSASAELAGEGGTKFWAKYAQGEFKAEADLHLIFELILQLCVDAYAWAEAGVWRFKVKTSKTWNLLNYPYRPGLRLGIEGLKKPIAYSSKTGFSLPSFDDINWVLPSFNAKGMLETGIDAAGGDEEEGSPKSRQACPVIEED